MRRDFQHITVGLILEELANDGIRISRSTLFRRMKDTKGFPLGKRLAPRIKGGHQWRAYTREEAEKIKLLVKQCYGQK